MKNLNGKTALITGAGSGIGRALAQVLAKKGVNLALNDCNLDSLKETKQLIDNKSIKVGLYPYDVANREQVYANRDSILADFGSLDIVINNAGIVVTNTTIQHINYSDIERVVDVNMWGVVYGTKAYLDHLLQRPEAAIVNLSSVFGMIGFANQAAYCMTKFAVRGFSETLRMELKQTRVCVTTVHPGGIKTNIVLNSTQANEQVKQQLAQDFANVARTTPESAAQKIVQGIISKKRRVIVGIDGRVIDLMARLLPVLYTDIVYAQYKKQANFDQF